MTFNLEFKLPSISEQLHLPIDPKALDICSSKEPPAKILTDHEAAAYSKLRPETQHHDLFGQRDGGSLNLVKVQIPRLGLLIGLLSKSHGIEPHRAFLVAWRSRHTPGGSSIYVGLTFDPYNPQTLRLRIEHEYLISVFSFNHIDISTNWLWTARSDSRAVAPMSSIDLESGVVDTEKLPSLALAAPESTQNEKSNTKDTKGKEGFNPQDPVDIDKRATALDSDQILNDAIDSDPATNLAKAVHHSLKRRLSSEGIAVLRIQSTFPDSKLPRKSIDSLAQPNFVNLPRLEQREKIMKYLWLGSDETSEPGAEAPKGLGTASLDRFLTLADEYQSQRSFKFNRFERLCLLDLLFAQDRLIRLDEKVQYQPPNEMESIEAFRKISRLNQPGFEDSYLAGQKLALALDEPRYWDSPDALNLFDLADSEALSSVDRLRQGLQKHIPLSMLDRAGRERRNIDEGADLLRKNEESRKLPFAKRPLIWLRLNLPFGWGLEKTPASDNVLDGLGPKEIKRIIDSSRHHSTYISPVVDNTARLLVAVIGGLLVLVPMAALSYITSLHWILIAAFLFTFNFSVAVAIVSKASNDQVIAATAAYGAILVIFVANRIQHPVYYLDFIASNDLQSFKVPI
ncbi:hypothetical protein G7Y89_g5749 [Cudoniella acicularis]|uniref:DUF6594 domain-containing protein n=1 Tax=Cudoniella acicularis TaxID=354080 RepID=A0A8H4W3P5_9HELO|nr:hypothetical protein G7Y89_g5749 [Cudoniella acicularis]